MKKAAPGPETSARGSGPSAARGPAPAPDESNPRANRPAGTCWAVNHTRSLEAPAPRLATSGRDSGKTVPFCRHVSWKWRAAAAIGRRHDAGRRGRGGAWRCEVAIPPHARQEVVHSDRLQQDLLDLLAEVPWSRSRREHHRDPREIRVHAHRREELPAVHAGHDEVEDDERRTCLAADAPAHPHRPRPRPRRSLRTVGTRRAPCAGRRRPRPRAHRLLYSPRSCSSLASHRPRAATPEAAGGARPLDPRRAPPRRGRGSAPRGPSRRSRP